MATRWTQQEVRFLKKHKDLSNDELAEMLCRTPIAIQDARRRYRTFTVKNFTRIQFTEEDAKILKENIKSNPDNLCRAFTLTAKKIGVPTNKIIGAYYTRKASTLYRKNLGFIFATISSKKTLENGKNRAAEGSTKRTLKQKIKELFKIK